MKKCTYKMVICLLLSVVLLFSGGCHMNGVTGYSGNNNLKIAGNYICFEERNGVIEAVLKQGIIAVKDGKITSIEDMTDGLDEVVYLDDDCVIFPGLIDLHSHVEYSGFQLWESEENEVPWDNRFEWRRSAQYVVDLKEKHGALIERWEEPLGEGEAVIGDLMEYFAEAQAAAGGTTLIQGYNQSDDYDTADSHEKVDLIRDTCFADDLGVESGQETQCVIQVFKPDAPLNSEHPETYLPTIDTSKWKEVRELMPDEETDYISRILESIKSETSGGWLIHLAEGRAGNLLDSTDPYSALEFNRFKEAILEGIYNGDFTAEDVAKAHITLIHACGLDLDNKDDYEFVRDCGIGLVWSPVSNLLLYEDTPDFYEHLGDGLLRIGIGSDWSPSGSKSVWDECKFAYSFMQKYAEDHVSSAEDLLKACTYTAAEMLGNENVGNIEEGAFADLFIVKGGKPINGSKEAALETFMETGDGGTLAVMVGGRIVYADREFLHAAMGGEIPASYGNYETGIPALKDKYFLVPSLFEGYTFEALYQTYFDVLEDADVEPSGLRSAEDAVYTQVMEELEGRFGEP